MDESHAVGVMAKARTVQFRCLAVRLRVTSLMSYPARGRAGFKPI